MTETTHFQANPAMVPQPLPQPEEIPADVATDDVVIEEIGNDEPIAVYSQPVDEPVDDPEDSVASDDPVLDTALLDDDE